MTFDFERAFRPLVESALAAIHHVEGHHPGQDDPLREVALQGLRIAQAILETHDNRVWADARVRAPAPLRPWQPT